MIEVKMAQEEIYIEIESTIDQLIENAEAMNRALKTELTQVEIDAFQNTQESLLAHLIYMDRTLESQRKELKLPNEKSISSKLKKKMTKFEELNKQFIKHLPGSMPVIHFQKKSGRKKPIQTKRRKFSKANKEQAF